MSSVCTVYVDWKLYGVFNSVQEAKAICKAKTLKGEKCYIERVRPSGRKSLIEYFETINKWKEFNI